MTGRVQPRRFESQIRRILRPLLSLPTGPFHEDEIASFIVGECGRLGLDCERDDHGNLLVRYAFGRRTGSTAWMAHMDHPALETLPRRDRQTVHARMLGHVLPRYLRRAPVIVIDPDGRTTSTRIAAVPRASWSLDRTVRLDTAEAIPARSLVVFDLPCFRRTGSKIHSRQCDDLAGVGAILMALEELVRREVRAQVWGVFTRAEEVGFIGATALAQSGFLSREQPVISVECSAERPSVRLGRGFVIRVGDALTTFDPTLAYALSRLARSIAERDATFRYQRALMDGGICEASPLVAFGYRTAAACLPLGAYHNMGPGGTLVPESIHAHDLADLVRFIVEAAGSSRALAQSQREFRQRFEQRYRTHAGRLLRAPGRQSGKR